MPHPRSLLALLGYLFLHTLCAQTQPEIEWSKPYRVSHNYRLFGVVGDEHGAFVFFDKHIITLFRGTRQSVLVDVHSKNTVTKRLNDLPFRYRKKFMRLADVHQIDGQIYYLTTFFNEAQRKRYLFVQNAQGSKLTPSSKPEILTELTVNNRDQGQFHIEFAPDSSRIVVIADDGAKSKEKARIKVHVLSRSFEQLWQRQVTLPYPGNEFDITDVAVDKQGRVFVLGVTDPGGSFLRPERVPTHEYVLLMFSEDGSDQTRTTLRARDRYINDLVLAPQPDGNLRLVGLFSTERRQNVRGVYTTLFDTYTGTLVEPEYQDFSFDIRTKDLSYFGRRRASRIESENDQKRLAELSNYNIERIHRLADGSLIVLAEQQYVKTQTRFDASGRWQTVTSYHFNDIVIFKITPDGKLQWTSVIPKSQVDINNYGQLGFSSFDMAQGLFIVFNDNETGNLLLRNSVALVELNPKDGAVLAHTDISKGLRRPLILPRSVFRLDRNQLIVPVLTGHDYRLARVQLLTKS